MKRIQIIAVSLALVIAIGTSAFSPFAKVAPASKPGFTNYTFFNKVGSSGSTTKSDYIYQTGHCAFSETLQCRGTWTQTDEPTTGQAPASDATFVGDVANDPGAWTNP